MAKRPLPDRKPMPMTIGDPVVEDGRITGDWIGKSEAIRLAQVHGLKRGFDLHREIEVAFWIYSVTRAKRAQGETQSEQSDFLKALVERAALMEECMEKMSLDVNYKIYREWPNESTQTGCTHRLAADSRSLHRAAKRALRRHKKETRNHRPADAVVPLVSKLIEIYADGTGRRVGQSKGGFGWEGLYHGPLHRFVEDCLDIVGVTMTNAALGKKLERGLKVLKTEVT